VAEAFWRENGFSLSFGEWRQERASAFALLVTGWDEMAKLTHWGLRGF